MATTPDVRITKPGTLGDIYYRNATGALVPLPIPGDAATKSYILGIDAGVPAWRAASGDSVFAGLYPSSELYPDSTVYPEAP